MEQADENKIKDIQEELIGYLKVCRSFDEYDDLREVLKTLAGFSARASWIRSVIIKSPNQKFIRLRIDHIDPFLEELDRQFKIWSRVQSVEEFEWQKSLKG